MKQIRRIAVNNGNYRAIYIDKNGIYYIVLEDENGNKDKDDFWNYQLNKEDLEKLYNEYYSGKIPEGFWNGYTVVKNPLENALDGDVIMLLNWYRYNQRSK